jgi:DNA invertase Pin-like site-specific DNA recombinase
VKKAVSYIRTSADSQDGCASLAAQSEIVTKYAEANGIVIVEAFTDEGIAPNLSNRDHMFSMVDAGAVDAILIVSETRLLRCLHPMKVTPSLHLIASSQPCAIPMPHAKTKPWR